MATHYDVLGIGHEATPDAIRRAYKKVALETHPDKKGDNGTAFQEVATAYETLKDAKKRASYDAVLRQERTTRAERLRRAQQEEASLREDMEKLARDFARRKAELEEAARQAQQSRQARSGGSAGARFYVSATGGGTCYHLTPTCSGLRQAAVTATSTTGGRRLCHTCAKAAAKPLTVLPPTRPASASARQEPVRTYYTTRTGSKYHTDRCCNGLRKATQLFESDCRPAGKEACSICM